MQTHELENRHQFLKTLEIDSFIFWKKKINQRIEGSHFEYPLTETKGYGQKLELANIVKKNTCKQELRNEQIRCITMDEK